MEIPQGIALGGCVGIINYLLIGLTNNEEKPKKSQVLLIILIAVRLLVIALVLFFVGWLYYAKNLKAFNLFATAGGYLIIVAINIILARIGGESGHTAEHI